MKKKKKKKKGFRQRALNFIKGVLSDDDKVMGHEWNPKFKRKLRAYSFESKQPIGNGSYSENLMQITEWNNGEGYDFSVVMGNKEKMYSMHMDEIELLLVALDKMNHFSFDRDEILIKNNG